MPIITVYNNKGGVGKSTLTVGIAEFLAANRKRSVLVIDLDAQASTAGALLGRDCLDQAIEHGKSIAAVMEEILRIRSPLRSVSEYLAIRPAKAARRTPLAEMAVLAADKPGIISVERDMTQDQDLLSLREWLKPALEDFEYVLIDLPGNIDRRNKLPFGALLMSDHVLVPVEPTQIALRALTDTFDLIRDAGEVGCTGRPNVIGLVLNKTDKRREQYRRQIPYILEAATNGMVPPVFDNSIPDTPKLATATDESHDFDTLKERFASYYDHVRKVARELEERCGTYTPSSRADSARFATRIRDLFRTMWSKDRSFEPTCPL